MEYHNYGLYNDINHAVEQFKKEFHEDCTIIEERKFSPNDALSIRLVGKNNTAFLFTPQFGGPGFSLARDKVKHVKSGE